MPCTPPEPDSGIDVEDLTMLIGPDQSEALLEIVLPTLRESTSSFTPCPSEPSSWSSQMPRSIQEILDHADELAERFETYCQGHCW